MAKRRGRHFRYLLLTFHTHYARKGNGTPPLTGERAQATFRGRPRGRFGSVGSCKGWMRGRPRGRFGSVGSEAEALPRRRTRLGSTQAGGATL